MFDYTDIGMMIYVFILFIIFLKEVCLNSYCKGVMEDNKILIHNLLTNNSPVDYLSITVFLRLKDIETDRYALTNFLKKVRKIVKTQGVVIIEVREVFLQVKEEERVDSIIRRIFLPLQSIKDKLVFHDLLPSIEGKIQAVLNEE